MAVILHWFLPANGDPRTDLSLGNAVGAACSPAPISISYLWSVSRDRYW